MLYLSCPNYPHCEVGKVTQIIQHKIPERPNTKSIFMRIGVYENLLKICFTQIQGTGALRLNHPSPYFF